MQKYQAYIKRRQDMESALAVLGLIGKKSTHATAENVGRIHSLDVKAIIHFQPSDGAKNYHDSSSLDAALARAARQMWPQLRERAEQILRESVRAALVAAEDEVTAAAAEIAAAKVAGVDTDN